jgi:hypothetical protein
MSAPTHSGNGSTLNGTLIPERIDKGEDPQSWPIITLIRSAPGCAPPATAREQRRMFIVYFRVSD